MHRVMLVDDEIIVRVGMRQLIPWSSYNAEIVAESSNGQQALKLLEQDTIDLILVDIKMPTMNGLEFMEAIQHVDLVKRPIIIVLSAYAEYEYVRKAFVLGAADYIVKEDIGKPASTQIIANSLAKLEQRDLSKDQNEAPPLYSFEREKIQWLRSYLIENESIVKMEHSKLVKDAWFAHSYTTQQVVMLFHVEQLQGSDEGEVDQHISSYIQATLKEIVRRFDTKNLVIDLNYSDYVIISHIGFQYSAMETRQLVVEMVNQIKGQLKNYMNLTVSGAVSDVSSGHKNWKRLLLEVGNLIKLRFYDGTGRVYFYEDLQRFTSTDPSIKFNWEIRGLLYKLEMGQSWVEEWRLSIKSLQQYGQINPDIVISKYRTLLWELESLLYLRGLNWSDVLGDRESPHEVLDQLYDNTAILLWLEQLISTVEKCIDAKHLMPSTHPGLVEMACKIMDRDYAQPISLAQISEQIGVNASYLSKIFSKETGENLIDYLTKKRIEKAKELLQSKLKIYEVGERAGYHNQTHFSRVFKKNTGLTPIQYRDQIYRDQPYEKDKGEYFYEETASVIN
ncbi:response regulator [Paenibacillus yanchengensis]|uniref:Response regulator n=1 Tax=Paenibacillus yanchengensis TaxID=2035833 RepID=A0ABW4YKA0_9BACL